MKIVFVCPTSHIKPYHGRSDFEISMGAAWTVIINMARTFVGFGHDVIVLNHCPSPGVYDGVKYPCRQIPEDIGKVKKELEGTDVLIVNRGGSLDWHDCLEKFAGITGYKKILRTGDRGGAERGQPEKFAKFNKVVSTSKWLSAINAEANNSLPPSLFVGIPAGVDTEVFRPSDDVDRFSIVFCGAVVRPRRPHLTYPVFDIVKQMRPDLPFTLHIIGSAAVWGGPPEGNKEPTSIAFRKMLNEFYEKHARKYGTDVIHYSDLPNRKIAEMLPHMGMHLYPTTTETCGVSIIESQACGVPVIVPQDSRKTAVKERIRHNVTGIYKYFDKLQEVARAVIDVATNDELHNKIRRNAREKAEKENDWKVICKRWEREVFMDSPIEVREEKKETIGVGVLSYQNRPMLEKCINSLMQNADMPVEVVVWDNASRKYGCDNVDWLKKNYPEIKIMESSENVGCTASRNAVVEYFRTQRPDMKYMLFTDMDVEFYRGFLSAMYEKAEKHPDAAIVAYEEANCGFTPDENGRISECMSICNLHRLKSFDIFSEGGFVPESVLEDTGAPAPTPTRPCANALTHGNGTLTW